MNDYYHYGHSEIAVGKKKQKFRSYKRVKPKTVAPNSLSATTLLHSQKPKPRPGGKASFLAVLIATVNYNLS